MSETSTGQDLQYKRVQQITGEWILVEVVDKTVEVFAVQNRYMGEVQSWEWNTTESVDKRRCEGKILNRRICYSFANKTAMVVRILPIYHKPHFKIKDHQPSVFCLNEIRGLYEKWKKDEGERMRERKEGRRKERRKEGREGGKNHPGIAKTWGWDTRIKLSFQHWKPTTYPHTLLVSLPIHNSVYVQNTFSKLPHFGEKAIVKIDLPIQQ